MGFTNDLLLRTLQTLKYIQGGGYTGQKFSYVRQARDASS